MKNSGTMASPPRVSVIVIFLDAQEFLAEAVESVFAQAYESWELLLVDDGSTDGSAVIARRYADAHPQQVRYLCHPGHANLGMSAARNLGVRNASAEYIAFLDADDVWLPTILADQVAILDGHPEAALVYGALQYWFSWTGDPRDRDRDYVENLGVTPDTIVSPPRLLALFLEDRAAVPSGLLVRRVVVTQVGGFEDVFRGEYEDQVFCAKVCATAPVYASGRSWYRYRQHPKSCVARGLRTGETSEARLIFLRWLARYLSDKRIADRDVWWAVDGEFWRQMHPMVWTSLAFGRRVVSRIGRTLSRASHEAAAKLQ
jgi:glycosyltransferase involved in cell wall biosynthesis